MMIKNTLTLGVLAFSLAAGVVQAQSLRTCEHEISEVNRFLAENGISGIADTRDVARTLRHINQTRRLPSKYITSAQAKRLGWSGDANSSLWGRGKATNNKLIGGDRFSSPLLPRGTNWLSADIGVVNGYRGRLRLIYSLNSPRRYIDVNNSQNLVGLETCL